MNMNTNFFHRDIRGFTLPEIMMTVGIFGLVMAGTFAVYLSSQKMWHSISLAMETSFDTSLILEKMVYGVGLNSGLRSAESSSVSVIPSGSDWTLSYVDPDGTTNSVNYDSALGQISYSNSGTTDSSIIGRNIVSAAVTNTGDGLSMAIKVGKSKGMFSSTNEMSTFVKFRN